MSVNSKMTALMNAIRSKAGISGLLSLDAANAAVDGIQTGITPTGNINITENGTYDVTEYAEAVVNVPQGEIYPDEYVTDGLTAWYDAINNTRNGHNASATTWEDLSGNGYDLKLSLGNAPIVGDNFMYFYGGRLTSDNAPAKTDADYPKFVEIVVQKTPINASQFVAGLNNTGFGTIYQRVETIAFQLQAGSATATVLPAVDDKMQSFFGANSAIIGEDRSWKPPTTASGGWDRTPNISIGAYTSLSQYVFIGYICSYRLYNKVLSVYERLQNFEQDKKRFGINSGIGLAELFDALPTLPTDTSKTIKVSSAQLAEASAETIAIATGKGWTVA